MTPAPAAALADQPARADARHLTDDQIVEVIGSLVRLHLEVERGLRPPQHLAPYLTPAAQRQIQLNPRRVFPHGGPVHPRDIGTPQLTRYADGRIHASLTAREQHDRWSAILLQLTTGRDGQLAVSELQRVPQRPLARHVERSAQSDLRGLLEWVERERDIVEAGHVAEREAGSSTSRHASRLAELDREVADLQTRVSHREQVEATKHSLEAPPLYVTKLLGQPPAHNTWQRLQWDSARDAIEEYRQCYQVEGDAALGPLPTNQEQQEARSEVARLTQAIQQQLRRNNSDLAISPDRSHALER
ncbi:Rv3235 family protein [Salsipaludibacter albus]|uniref:Rv3235 family protein n=1 Tax=Salsipaludibacter albus TaxID=2849650 RepID=UPI001EE49FE6|nr:Rv3235 family protein [Salsipaludibacter albus]MBY5161482.1 hypothetical protein [Salsipaludibacter albus]